MGIAEGFDPIIEYCEKNNQNDKDLPLGVLPNLEDAKWDAPPQVDHAVITPWPTTVTIPHPLPPLDEIGEVQLTALPTSNYVYPDPQIPNLLNPQERRSLPTHAPAPAPAHHTIEKKKKKERAQKAMPSFTLTPDQLRLHQALRAQAALRQAQSQPRPVLRPLFAFTFDR